MGAEPNPPESVQSLRRSSLRFCLRSVIHSHSNREQQGDRVRGLRASQYKPHSTEIGFLECSHLQRRLQGQQSKSEVAPGHPNESEKEGVEDECVNPAGDVSRAMATVMGMAGVPRRFYTETDAKRGWWKKQEKQMRQRKKVKGGTPESKAGGGGKMTERCPSGLEESTKHFGHQDSRSKCSREREVNLGKPSTSPKSQ